MDYETSDGSQFSLREEFRYDCDIPRFEGTLITAFVDGIAFAGKSPRRMDDMDEVDVIQYLEPIPPSNVFPLLPAGFTVAPTFDMAVHFLKSPQFTYEDRLPGRTFVADTFLAEVAVLEHLKQHPHPSIARYYGATLKDGRVTHLCLNRCYCNLAEYFRVGLSRQESERLLARIHEGVKHLHSLGLAHNDINPENICVDANGHAVIVDFDCCLPFGQRLMKHVADLDASSADYPVSAKENDLRGLADIETLLRRLEATPAVQMRPDESTSSSNLIGEDQA